MSSSNKWGSLVILAQSTPNLFEAKGKEGEQVEQAQESTKDFQNANEQRVGGEVNHVFEEDEDGKDRKELPCCTKVSALFCGHPVQSDKVTWPDQANDNAKDESKENVKAFNDVTVPVHPEEPLQESRGGDRHLAGVGRVRHVALLR